MEKQNSEPSTPRPQVDEARRRLVKSAGKATVAAAATTLVLASSLKSNQAHALTLYMEEDPA